MKIALALGTRPEIIKLSPLIRELERRQINYILIHTNQHYSSAIDQVFFDELSLRQPDYNLNVHNLTQGAMVGTMLLKLEPILMQEEPDWVLVQGDTNSVLSGALAASKLGLKVGHIEAGLRSFDRTMPEEINRVVVDHLSDLLFCPTKVSKENALREGIVPSKVLTTGNTIVEAVEQNITLARQSKTAKKYRGEYMLLTLHRPSNVDTKEALSEIISSLENLARKLELPIIFPAHPRTQKALADFSLTPSPALIKLIEPVGYLEMLGLLEGAKLILTDSGGVQEEACILRVPCLTLRDSTERPETIEVGANLVVGTRSESILSGAHKMLASKRGWKNPFGDGTASRQIVDYLATSV